MKLLNEYEIAQQAQGVRIISGVEAKRRRYALNLLIDYVTVMGFKEIILPTIEPSALYAHMVDQARVEQIHTFIDREDKGLCLRPECTTTVQEVAAKYFGDCGKDIMLWYFERCYRHEPTEVGRYREFWQFGCEVINSDVWTKESIMRLACTLVEFFTGSYQINEYVRRDVGYYIEEGFEVIVPSLGEQKQVCGGGRYERGIGFALGFDRLMLVSKEMPYLT